MPTFAESRGVGFSGMPTSAFFEIIWRHSIENSKFKAFQGDQKSGRFTDVLNGIEKYYFDRYLTVQFEYFSSSLIRARELLQNQQKMTPQSMIVQFAILTDPVHVNVPKESFK